MSSKRKIKCLTLSEKLEVIKIMKSGMKKKDVSSFFGIPASTLSTIIKNQSAILKLGENSNNLSYKRHRKPDFPYFEQLLIEWAQEYKSNNGTLSGTVLREQAMKLSKSLGYYSFRASNGWLQLFKNRNATLFKKQRTYKKKNKELQNSTTHVESETETSNTCVKNVSQDSSTSNQAALEINKIELVSEDEENSNQSQTLEKLTEVNIFCENIKSSQEETPLCNFSELKETEDEGRMREHPKMDPHDAFGVYVASLLRMLPPEKALMLQPKIANIIISHGMEDLKQKF